jgi:hypothetical protein
LTPPHPFGATLWLKLILQDEELIKIKCSLSLST